MEKTQLFSILKMKMVWITDRMCDGPIFLHYSDDNKKNSFNNWGTDLYGLKTLHVSRPLNH